MSKNLKLFILGIFLIFLFFSLRIYNLTLLPVFCDEAIYIRWSQVMKAEPTLRFLPLFDGKQPLFMWLTIFLLPILKDPLLSGRFLSVLSGFGSMIGIFLLSYELFKDKKVSLFSTLLYAVVPFFVFFDRMALVDSMLMMWGIWIFYLGTLLVRLLRLDLAMMTGMVLGAALITKSPAVFFAILLPSVMILRDKKTPRRDFIKIGGLFLVVYIFAYVIFNFLRLGPNFQMIAIRNKDFVFSFQEIVSHPLDPLKPHLGDLIEWLPNLFTPPIFLLAIAGLIWLWAKKKQRREAVFLTILMIVPLMVESIFAKGLTPRYILFAVWPLVILAGYSFSLVVSRLRLKTNLAVLLIVLVLLSALWYDWRLLVEPEKAPLPRKMRTGYLEIWTAGQGLREIAEFVKQKAKEKGVAVATEGNFGSLPEGLQIYLEKVPGVTVFGTGQVVVYQVPDSIKNAAKDNFAYFVVNESRMDVKHDPSLKLIKKFPKAIAPDGTQEFLFFYEVSL